MKRIIGETVDISDTVPFNNIIHITKIDEIIPVEIKMYSDGICRYIVSDNQNKTNNIIIMHNNYNEKFSLIIDKDTDTTMLIDLL